MTLSNAAYDLQTGLAEAYDVLADEFQSGVAIKLCNVPSTGTNAFNELVTITSSRFWEYSNFHKATLLEIAIAGDTVMDALTETTMLGFMNLATHVKIDNDVYVIRQGDTLSPTGTNPVWVLFLELYESDRQYSQL